MKRLSEALILAVLFALMIDARLASAQSFLFTFGTSGSGEGEFSGPGDVAVDGSGNIYIADTDNNRIQKFDSDGDFILMWGFGVIDGSNEFQICTNSCQEGTAGTGDGQFQEPFGIAVDSFDNIYVTDTGNNRIQKFDSDGNFILKFGGEGGGNGQFEEPLGVAVDSDDNIYVGDSGNNRIQKFDSNGNFILTFGTGGGGNGQFEAPTGVAISSTDDVYVVDSGNNRIQVFDSNGSFLLKFGSEGTDRGQFQEPVGIALDTVDNVYVADAGNNRILKFNSIGGFLVMWGFGVKNGSDNFQTCMNKCEEGISGNGEGQFNLPLGIDSTGKIHVGDSGNDRIQVFRIDVEFNGVFGTFGCSMAPVGVTPSVPLYLLIPVIVAIRRLWSWYIS